MHTLRDYWYAAAGSYRLTGDPLPLKLLGEPVVVFRDREGRAVALRDRCAHRGYPLHAGSVLEGRLRCPLHGWTFDSAGKCTAIPCEGPGAPLPAPKIPTYDCREQDGFIWICLSKGPPLRTSKLGPAWLQGSVSIEAPASSALELTVDLTHIGFSHGTHPLAEALKKGAMVEAEGAVYPHEFGFNVDWELPGGRVSRMCFDLPGTVRFEIPHDSKTCTFVFHVIPETESTCRIEWAASDPSADYQGSKVCESARVIDEDKKILETLARARKEDGWATEVHRDSDLPALLVRKILGWAAAGEWPERLKIWNEPKTLKMILPDLRGIEFDQDTKLDVHSRLIHKLMLEA